MPNHGLQLVLAVIAVIGGVGLYANIGGAFPGLRLEGTSATQPAAGITSHEAA